MKNRLQHERNARKLGATTFVTVFAGLCIAKFSNHVLSAEAFFEVFQIALMAGVVVYAFARIFKI